jgi:hypothetical protein
MQNLDKVMEYLNKLKRETIKNYVDNQLPGLIETRTKYPATHVKSFTAEVTPTHNIDKQYSFLMSSDEHLNTKSTAECRYGITNIQIKPFPNNNEYLAKLWLGGQTHELANPQTGGFWMTSDGRSIPIILCHEIAIEFQFGEWLEPVTVTWDLIAYRSHSILSPPAVGKNLGERQCLDPELETKGLWYHKDQPPTTIVQSVNSYQHVSNVTGDEAHTPYFSLPQTNGMPLAKLTVQFLDGDSDALSAVWLFTGPADDIRRLSRNSVTGCWELQQDITAPEHELFLDRNTRIQYSRLNGKQPPTKADVRLDTWNLTRVMCGMYGAMF